MSDTVDGLRAHQEASDVYFDQPCETCREEGKNVEAISFCSVCDTFLCKNCHNVHSRLPASRDHPVLHGEDMPKSLDAKPVRYPVCNLHAGKMKNRFCLYHSEMVCEKCQEKSHTCTSCDIQNIEDVSQTFDPTSIDKLESNISEAQERAVTIRACLLSASELVGSSEINMFSEVERFRDEAVALINRMYEETKVEIEESFSAKKRKISEQSGLVSKFTHQLNALSTDTSELKNNKFDVRGFIRYQELLPKINDTLESFNKVAVNLERTESHFRISNEFNSFLSGCSRLGDICSEKSKMINESKEQRNMVSKLSKSDSEATSIKTNEMVSTDDFDTASSQLETKSTSELLKTVSSEIRVERLEKLNVSIKEDKLACHITGIAVKQNGDILVLDWNNDKVKLFSSNGKLLSFLALPSLKLAYWPCEICLIDDNTAIVCLSGSNRLHILELSDANTIALKRNINVGDRVWGVTPYDYELVVSSGPTADTIKVVKMNGEVSWTVDTNKAGQKLFGNINCVSSFGPYTRKILVADKEKSTVSLLNVDRGEILRICSVKGKPAKHLAADRKGNVYVCYSSGDIDVWSENLSMVSCLDNDCQRESTAFAFNSHKRELLVSYESCDTIDRLILT